MVNHAPGREPRNYKIVLPTDGGPQNCPVKVCTGRAATRTTMWFHLFHRDVWDTVIILEEGNLPHPWFPLCNMLVPWRDMNERHLATAQ